eukprot:CAMPEP_0171062148 /NCGR_PEP_ID=MMETSP0766_2-20121228/4901_1 /TAXON_ID=439317 /ORGANISM="Gambierdiscus australes, Strain CAWD 149" /LENGTH=45 /DNA_ID= /DNA_START= /DNA_END= /DNA_ORIENTATION=
MHQPTGAVAELHCVPPLVRQGVNQGGIDKAPQGVLVNLNPEQCAT